MKLKNTFTISTIIMALIVVSISSCKIDTLTDPNNPSLEAIEADASVAELNNLVTGMESGMRTNLDTYLDDCGVIGREYYRFSGADPRFTQDLLGGGASVLDNNTFYLVNPWYQRYRVVRNGWILRHAVDNTSADITDEQKNGYRGFAKTIQAYQMLLNLNMTFENGIRIDVEDPENLGPIISGYHTSLDGIMSLLEDGYSNLTSAGDAFAFTLSSGFAGFDSPAGFAQFNRALAARVELYHGADFAAVLDMLTDSFLDLGGALSSGVYHVYSSGAGDILNDMYYPANSSPGGNARCVRNEIYTGAEAGDLRLSKIGVRDETAFQDDLSSDYDLLIYTSNIDPICVIRNEELILIYAEAKAKTGASADAETAINIIRNAAGLADYSGATDETSLVNEILFQRTYSLLGEGHRWADYRRLGKLGELPADRAGDDVWDGFPLPADEVF